MLLRIGFYPAHLFLLKNIKTHIMKKTLLTLAFLACTLSLTIAQEPLQPGTYYIENEASGTFLSSGANWGTRSVLSPHGIDIKVTLSEGAYTLTTQIQGANKAMRPSDAYMDQSGEWTITPLSDGTYAMFNGTNYLGYDASNASYWIPRLTFTDTNEKDTHWRFWSKEALMATMSEATKENPVDVTFFIQAPDFLIGDYRVTGKNVWGPDLTSTGGNIDASSYLRNNAVAEKFNTAQFNITQTLKGLPDGVYSLSVQGFYRVGSNTVAAAAHNNGTEQLAAYLYAGNKQAALPSVYNEAKSSSSTGWAYSTAAGYVPNTMSDAANCFNDGTSYMTTINDIVVTDGKLNIGITKNLSVTNDWCCFDNFTLKYYGKDTNLLKAEALAILDEYEAKNTTDDSEFASTISSLRTTVSGTDDYDAIKTAIQDVKKAYGFYVSKPEPDDTPIVVSNLLLENASLAQGISGWDADVSSYEGYNQQWNAYASGNKGALEAYAGLNNLEAGEFSIRQTVSLSPGMYRLNGYAFYRYGTTYNSDLNNESREISNAYMFAGENIKSVMRLGDIEATTYANTMAEALTAFNNGNYLNTIIFYITEPTTIEVGFSGEHTYTRSWFIMGPVTLEKINDHILEIEEEKNFGNVKLTYKKKWNQYSTISNQAIDHSEFDNYLTNAIADMDEITNKHQLETKDAEVWDELCKLIKTGTTASGQFDLTSLITNPSFTKGTDGWVIKNGLTWDNNGVVEKYNNAEGKVSQVLKGMPAGNYTLKVQGFYRPKSFIKANNDYVAGTNEETAELFLNDNKQTLKNINDDSRIHSSRPESDTYGAFDRTIPNTLNGANDAFDNNLYWNILRTETTEDGDMSLGISYHDGLSSNWLSFDNFKLYYGATTEELSLLTTEKFLLKEDTYANVTTDIELKAGQLNSLCVPFDLDASMFESAYTIVNIDYNADEQTLVGTLAPTNELKAGTPCFVRVGSDMTLKGKDVLVHAALPDTIPMLWEGEGNMVGYYGKSSLTRAYRLDDGDESMTYSLAKLNVPGYKTIILLPSTIAGKVKSLTFEMIDFENMDITVNLENAQAHSFINTARYVTSASSSIIAKYNYAPPARRDEPKSVMVPVPQKDIPSIIEYSQSSDFANSTTLNIPANEDFIEIVNLTPQQTYYYRIITGKDEVSKGQIHTEGTLRMIKVPSVSNVRDLGGWLTLDGNRVNYGLVYRGGEMNAEHEMVEADRAELRRLGIGAEVDLRQDIDFGNTIISTSALGNDVPYIYVNQSMFGDDALQQDVEKYKAIFPFILNNLREGRSVYFHCIWGADRTGATAFLLEGLIGMTIDQMYKDYELTSFSIAGMREKTGLDSKFNYINTLPGKTLQERFFNYWNTVVGIPEEDLCEFIKRMTNGTSSLVTEISDVKADIKDSDESAIYYSIDGRRQATLQPGLNIIRRSDGSVKKVFMK